jgi:hypothetical protein
MVAKIISPVMFYKNNRTRGVETGIKLRFLLKSLEHYEKKIRSEPRHVVHTCDPSYAGRVGRSITVLVQDQAKSARP